MYSVNPRTNTTYKSCDECRVSSKATKKRRIEREDANLEAGNKFCRRGRHQVDVANFRRLLGFVRGPPQEVELEIACNECAVAENEVSAIKHKKYREKTVQEKIDRLEQNTLTTGNCGCENPDCVMDFDDYTKTLKALGDVYDDSMSKRIVGLVLEWDHLIRKKKSRAVSQIYNDELRRIEIELCQLLCVFCHRLKTYKNADYIPLGCKYITGKNCWSANHVQ